MYDIQIEKLEWVIDNWNLIKDNPARAMADFEDNFNLKLVMYSGLCRNCDFWGLEADLQREMFNTFPKFSRDFHFPLSDFESYSHMTNMTETSERLELAKHCLKFLKDIKKYRKF